MADSKELKIVVVGDASKLNKTFKSASKSADGFGKKMAGMGKLAAIGLAGLGVGAAVAGKKMIDMASDAAEVQSKMEVVFGKALPALTKEIDAFSAATGTSRFAMREQAADLGALLEPLVGSKKAAADMSLQFTELATDLGSFNNVPTDEALLAIRSGLVGEAEPLRRFGVLLNEAAVKAEGLRLGLVKGKEAMSEQEKVQARASLIMQQTTLAQGDAERTAGSMANQMKALNTAVSDTATEIGLALLPAALTVVTAFNTHWPTIKRVAGTVFEALGTGISEVVGFFRTHWATISRVTTTALETIQRVSEIVWPKVQEAAAKAVAWYRGTLQPAIQNVVAAVTAIWNKFGDDITKVATVAFKTVTTVVRNGLAIIQAAVEVVLAVIRGDWSEAWNGLKTIVSKTLNSVSTIVSGFVTIAYTAAKAIGAAIVGGIVDGITGLATSVGNKIKSGVQAGIDAAKGFFGIHSPSTVTRDEIGKPLAEGVVAGMDGGLALLAPAMKKKIAAAVAQAQAVVDAAKTRMQASFSLLSDKLMRAFDAETSGHQTPAEAMLAQISDRRQTEDLQHALQEAMLGGDADAIARAQEDIQIAALQKQAENERRAYEDQRDALREQLGNRLTALTAHFEKEGGTVADAMLRINKIMRAFGITFAESGQLIGAQFVKGLQTAIGGAAAGAAGVHGALTGGNANPSMPPIVTQILLDGKVVAETVRNQNAIYQRANVAV